MYCCIIKNALNKLLQTNYMLFTFFELIKIKGSITELSAHFTGKPFNLMLKNESERYYAKATLFQKLT